MTRFLDDTGTTVSQLAERAQITKQAMAELVLHLETHGYVVRQPSPTDGRSKLVVPTRRGLEVVALAQSLVPQVENVVDRAVGQDRAAGLRHDLAAIRATAELEVAALRSPA